MGELPFRNYLRKKTQMYIYIIMHLRVKICIRSEDESRDGDDDEAKLGVCRTASSLSMSDLSLVSEGACCIGTSANIFAVRPCKVC